MALIEWLKFYIEYWGINALPVKPDRVPAVPWREWANKKLDMKTAVYLYRKALSNARKEGLDPDKLGAVVLTGPYQKRLERPVIVIDLDKPLFEDTGEKFVKEGYIVVKTRRGYRIHARLSDKNSLPYLMRMWREEDNRKEGVGEVAVTFPHPWTNPPSKRRVNNKYFTYTFVKPDGTTTVSYKYAVENLKKLPVMSLSEIMSDLATYELIELTEFRPGMDGATSLTAKMRKYEGGVKKRPVYSTMEEFLANAVTEPMLPPCIAVVLAAYLYNEGFVSDAERILALYPSLFEKLAEHAVLNPYEDFTIRHGQRFIFSAVFTLFVAHIVDYIKFKEIITILGKAVEDWPHDEGYPLDKKLQYLLLMDEEGNIYPRYARAGVIGEMLASTGICSECILKETCRAKNKSPCPWCAFRNLEHIRQIMIPYEEHLIR